MIEYNLCHANAVSQQSKRSRRKKHQSERHQSNQHNLGGIQPRRLMSEVFSSSRTLKVDFISRSNHKNCVCVYVMHFAYIDHSVNCLPCSRQNLLCQIPKFIYSVNILNLAKCSVKPYQPQLFIQQNKWKTQNRHYAYAKHHQPYNLFVAVEDRNWPIPLIFLKVILLIYFYHSAIRNPWLSLNFGMTKKNLAVLIALNCRNQISKQT